MIGAIRINRARAAAPFRRVVCLLAVCLLCGCFLTVPASADGRPHYVFRFENLNGGDTGQRETLLIRDGWVLSAGETLEFSGWVAVSGGISAYEYAFVPVGDTSSAGSAEWRTPTEVNIASRGDLTKNGVAHSSGHRTAGFSMKITAPADTDGYFDFYLRAVTKSGYRCDLLAVTDVTVGLPDSDDGEKYTVNLERCVRDADGLSGVRLRQDGSGISLSVGGVLPLGEFNLNAFESVSITYKVASSFTEQKGTRCAAIGIKASSDVTASDVTASDVTASDVTASGVTAAGVTAAGVTAAGGMPSPYNRDGKYDMSDSLILGRLRAGEGTRTMVLDLTGTDGRRQLFLSAFLFGGNTVTVTDISFTYNGKSATRTAARIFCSGDLSPYLSGSNAVETSTVSDAALGDVLRIRAATDTNDPYVYFNAESLLAEENIRINADEYRYLVLLVRARQGNGSGSMTFYLCAGDIGGPTEDCTATIRLETDGQWHYRLIDLSQKNTWSGTVHGWRFDMINGSCAEGDYVDYASVQFFRTETAAREVMSGNPLKPDTVYRSGDALVMRDDREEKDSLQAEYQPDAADIRIPAETETAETETDGTDTTASDGDGGTDSSPVPDTAADTGTGEASDTGTAGSSDGCRSAAGALPAMLLPLIGMIPAVSAGRGKKPRAKQ